MANRIKLEELIKRVTDRTNHDRKDVQVVVEATLDEIYQSMKRTERVVLRNFGTFHIDRKYNRTNREESTVFKFNPSQKWRALFGWSSSYKGKL